VTVSDLAYTLFSPSCLSTQHFPLLNYRRMTGLRDTTPVLEVRCRLSSPTVLLYINTEHRVYNCSNRDSHQMAKTTYHWEEYIAMFAENFSNENVIKMHKKMVYHLTSHSFRELSKNCFGRTQLFFLCPYAPLYRHLKINHYMNTYPQK
jgi:hypothetical protein